MPAPNDTTVLDIDQLRDVSMEDPELMRELATALIDDANAKLPGLRDAVEQADSEGCARLAHYVKGACSNVGAASMAAILEQIEQKAVARDFVACRVSLVSLAAELQKFSSQAAAI